jgi:hypothetical protein
MRMRMWMGDNVRLGYLVIQMSISGSVIGKKQNRKVCDFEVQN